jgi:predicted 2-oxoglutarate/Fe(II)-dependent dioxygenase YbiX
VRPPEANVAIADGIYRLQVASATACSEIVAAAERTDAWRPAEINANLDVDRTIRDAEVVHEHAQPALFASARNLLFDATRDLAARLAPSSVLAELQLVRYHAGGRYVDHRDTPALGATPRALSIVWYLNDGFGGGATAFTDAAIAVEPHAGTAVAFLPDRLHRAEPVTAGTKIVLTAWYHIPPSLNAP